MRVSSSSELQLLSEEELESALSESESEIQTTASEISTLTLCAVVDSPASRFKINKSSAPRHIRQKLS